MIDALEVRRSEAVRLMEQGQLEGWQAFELICWPPKGSRLERPRIRRDYPEGVRAEAERLAAQGLTVEQAARRLGIPWATIEMWRSSEWREKRAAA